MFCGSGGSKSRRAEAAGAELSGRMRDQNCTPLWREAHFEVKMLQQNSSSLPEHFGSWVGQKAHATIPEHSWKLSYWKSACGCGVEHISMSKCQKHVRTVFWTFKRHSFEAAGRFCTEQSEANGCFGSSKNDGVWTGSAKMHVAWQAQCKRHLHQICCEVRVLISWEGLHFGASDP